MKLKELTNIDLLDHPLIVIVVILATLTAYVTYAIARDDEKRKVWVDACLEVDGKPYIDDLHSGIGNSVCLKPDSILTVPGYEL